MSRLRVFRSDETNPFPADEPRILSFEFYAPLIRAERAMQPLRQARVRQTRQGTSRGSERVSIRETIPMLRVFRNPWDR